MSIILYLVAIVATNLAFTKLGLIAAFGLVAPMAALFAGVPFALRDIVQRRHGYVVTVVAILAACAVTWFMSPALAMASATAFLAGELLDLTVFTTLESRAGFLGSSVVSNIAGAVVDSAIFLSIAFGSLAFFPGQVVAKIVTGTIASVAIVLIRRRA